MQMEKTSQFKMLDERYFMPAFSRDMALVKGEGSRVWDAEGKEYIDCVAGIAVCSTGHCHPAVVKAICDQAHELIHCSNLYYVPHQGDLAQKLTEITGMHKVFFSNSGAEATDGALKLAGVRTGKRSSSRLPTDSTGGPWVHLPLRTNQQYANLLNRWAYPARSSNMAISRG